jgi:hypothetical protein
MIFKKRCAAICPHDADNRCTREFGHLGWHTGKDIKWAGGEPKPISEPKPVSQPKQTAVRPIVRQTCPCGWLPPKSLKIVLTMPFIGKAQVSYKCPVCGRGLDHNMGDPS